MCQRVDQHRYAQHVGPENELLPLLVRDLSSRGECRYALGPFSFGERHLGHERVQVFDDALHDGSQALVLTFGEAGESLICDLVWQGPPAGGGTHFRSMLVLDDSGDRPSRSNALVRPILRRSASLIGTASNQEAASAGRSNG